MRCSPSLLIALALGACSSESQDPQEDAGISYQDAAFADVQVSGRWALRATEVSGPGTTQGLELSHDVEQGTVTGSFCTPDEAWSCGEPIITGTVEGRRMNLGWMTTIDGDERDETLRVEFSDDEHFAGELEQLTEAGVKRFAVEGEPWPGQ